MTRAIGLIAGVILVCFSTAFAAQPQAGVGLTIYNDNFAVVRESRQMDFEKGLNTVKFTGVASAIDPTTVNFQCLTAPKAVSILEQNYEYDLVNSESLLQRYIDKDVALVLRGSGADVGKRLSGTLLAFVGNDFILKSPDGDVEIINRSGVENISLTKLPEDLVTRPTLVWLADSQDKASELCQITYTTGQIGWKADYSAILNQEETQIDFSGWVTIDNKSGAIYKDSTIKLIAGDVRRIVEPQPMYKGRTVLGAEMAMDARGFEEKPFMEYHLYTLGRKSTINDNQVKQIEFIDPAIGVPTKKLYIYERTKIADKVQIKIEFENTEENKLGIALPKGRVRVFKRDPADNVLEFVGEDEIDHTARKEKLSLYIGNAFDVVPEYTPVDTRVDRRMRRETHRIELRNRKDEAVTVFVDEKFPRWVNWTIDKATHSYNKHDAYTARFEVKLDADSTQTVEYTATQTW